MLVLLSSCAPACNSVSTVKGLNKPLPLPLPFKNSRFQLKLNTEALLKWKAFRHRYVLIKKVWVWHFPIIQKIKSSYRDFLFLLEFSLEDFDLLSMKTKTIFLRLHRCMTTVCCHRFFQPTSVQTPFHN